MTPSHACYVFFPTLSPCRSLPFILGIFPDPFFWLSNLHRASSLLIMYYFCIHQHQHLPPPPFHHIVTVFISLRTSMPNYHDRIPFHLPRDGCCGDSVLYSLRFGPFFGTCVNPILCRLYINLVLTQPLWYDEYIGKDFRRQ